MEIEEIIERYLKPKLDEECKRLSIGKNFIQGIYGMYRKGFEVGRCSPIFNENNELIGVKIRISEGLGRLEAEFTFYHEMKEAQYYHELFSRNIQNEASIEEGMKSLKYKEIRADLYAIKRILEDKFTYLFRKIKDSFKIF